ncbi:MAG: excalibur calcium-binding domain-containing protein [Acidimicrobiia bacterium]|nr:excalibur calcium-binding domain-containing protein [Acidimicrobiia bacterium]
MNATSNTSRPATSTRCYAGTPGYGPHLDRDGDGVACE